MTAADSPVIDVVVATETTGSEAESAAEVVDKMFELAFAVLVIETSA